MAANSKMTKYYAGVFVLMIVAVGALVYTFSQAGNAKTDKATDEALGKLGTKLDSYIGQNNAVPSTLQELGLNDMPATVTYTKLDSNRYKICASYKTASGGFDAGWASLLGGAFSPGLGDYPQQDELGYFDSYGLIYSHKKGENCQTIKPYVLDQTCSNEQELSYKCDQLIPPAPVQETTPSNTF